MISASDKFHEIASGQVIGPRAVLYASFDKQKSSNVGFFTLNQSALNGSDLLGASDNNPIQLWDTYAYRDFSDRLVSAEWERSIEFPYNVQSAICDVVLNNYDDYFTHGDEAPQSDMLPKRPIKLFAGYEGAEVVQQFVGLTEDVPAITESTKTAKLHAMDFLSEIAELDLTKVVVARDVTTDVVLAAIVEQFGVLPSQYSFETGSNTIPFVFFEKGQNAGEAIRKLVQAEGGKMWLDEVGILRFKPRTYIESSTAMMLPEYSILDITQNDSASIVNRVKISADVRIVQEFQSVYEKDPSEDSTSNLWVVPALSTLERQADLTDPCYSVVNPVLGKVAAVSWFTAKRSSGAEVTSGISVTGELSMNSYTMTFTNSNNFPVEIDELELWGEPAKVTDHIDYDAYDDESVEKYGEQLLEITDNQYFQSYRQCDSFAVWLLREYANYNSSINIDIKGNFAMQIGDIISIDYKYPGDYVIDSIKYRLESGILATSITAHKFVEVSFFRLDLSALDGGDVLG